MTCRQAPDPEIHFERLAITPEQISAWEICRHGQPKPAIRTQRNFGVLKAAEQSERKSSPD